MNNKVAVEFYLLFVDQTWDTVVHWVSKDIVDSGNNSIIKWAYDNILSENIVLMGIYNILSDDEDIYI